MTTPSTQKIKISLSVRLRKLLSYFLKGILIAVPIYTTYRIIKALVQTLDELLLLETPGLGILIVLGSLVLLGIIGSSIITRPIIDLLDELLSHIPFVKVIYTSIKDLIEAFVGEKSKFSKPVLVRIADGVFKPGFITQESLEDDGLTEMVSVYMPHSYALSGTVFFVEKTKLFPYHGSPTHLMKFIVSGGVTQIAEKEEQ